MQLFAGMRTVRVEVGNKTRTRHLDPVALQEAIIRELNSSRKRTPLRAVAAGNADCVLTLQVEDEREAQLNSQLFRAERERDIAWWEYYADFSEQLTSRGGRVLWTQEPWTACHGESAEAMKKKRVAGDWNNAEFRQAFFSQRYYSDLASQFVQNLLSK